MSKKHLVDPGDLANPLKLDSECLAAIVAVYSPLRKINLAVRVIKYVVDGIDPAVLLELAGKKEALDAMGLYLPSAGVNYGKIVGQSEERAKFFGKVSKANAVLLQRIGDVYAAIRQAHGKAGLQQIFPGLPDWIAELFRELVLADHGELTPWPLTTIEQLLTQAGQAPSFLIRPALDAEVSVQFTAAIGWARFGWKNAFEGWGDYYLRHLHQVRDALQSKTTADAKLFALLELYQSNTTPENSRHEQPLQKQRAAILTGLVDWLMPLAVEPGKTLRESVQQLLKRHVDSDAELRTIIHTRTEQVLQQGDAAQRNEAAQMLWRLFGSEARVTLQQHAETEAAARVRQTIQQLLSTPDGQSDGSAASALLVGLPPVEIPLGEIPLPEAAKKELQIWLQKRYEEADRQYKSLLARLKGLDQNPQNYMPQPPAAIEPADFARLIAYIEGASGKPGGNKFQQYFWQLPPFETWTLPDVQLIHVVRLLHAGQVLGFQPQLDSMHIANSELLEKHRTSSQPRYGLRELDAAVATLSEGTPGIIANAYLTQNNRYRSFLEWEPEAIWPLFVEHSKALHVALGPSPNRGSSYSSYDYFFADRRRNAFRVLGMLPSVPIEFVPALWEMALGDVKADRLPAQNGLASIEGKTERVLKSLEDGRQETRVAAAEWLGRMNDPAAIEPLKAAFRKEKQEFAKGIYMGALEALGADVDEFLDRKKLLKEAEAGLAKKRPKGMDWFPVSSLPAVHWADTNEAVEPTILHWWIVQTVQQKSPTCGPLLRRYLQLCRPADARGLGKFVLSAWMSEDTRTVPQEEAAGQAATHADQQFAIYGSKAWWVEAYKDRDNLYRMLFQQYREQFVGSAIGEKGMLAITSAMGDAECVKLCEQYLRKYFGRRLAQCKALIEVLAWMEHPLAIQILLSIGNRFRTKALRQAASEHVQALAEREGWTIDELADRTIPDAGFARPVDEEGQPTGTVAELVLDYGPRSFTVTLNDELEPVITREDGKGVKAPPAPAKSDDAEKAKEAKKAFSEAKKQVKEIVKLQSERLYEAVCTQRGWPFEDWQRYLARHPIVGKLCTRLVWSAFAPSKPGEAGEFLTNFRPLEDGSLTNEQDKPVTPDPRAIIRVAHDCNTPEPFRPLWNQHLKDYDVTPVFQQFGRRVFELPAERGESTEIKDFVGHMITTFKLRGKANRLGWVRGDAEDGGTFTRYRKPFPSLELQAVLEFTGSYLPENDIAAALGSLSFERLKNNREETTSWSRSAMPLKKVPPVLLSECYNDVYQIAAEGTGFDRDWEKKSYF